ncbi:MAG: hypothetical protein OXH86_06525 [Acidimicrobiaceae bacterium]|nr:hypothetical protein [Acidimicrobiaceae bacterium]MDE0496989.1 hypothetical protein [Acidimicrobiaceae bacterium]
MGLRTLVAFGAGGRRRGSGTDDMLRRRLLYVGMTRATDVLKIAVSGSGTIVDSLLAVQPV